MLRSTKGYFLLELLLSLSALLMLCLYLLPLLLELREQSQQLDLENRARQIMFEELQAKLISKETFSGYSFIQNGVEYKITWKDTGADQKEVCVRIEKNSFLPEIERCGILE
jgi:type II secretory pathway pseudopilin PulG